jgi:hypothetical protein
MWHSVSLSHSNKYRDHILYTRPSCGTVPVYHIPTSIEITYSIPDHHVAQCQSITFQLLLLPQIRPSTTEPKAHNYITINKSSLKRRYVSFVAHIVRSEVVRIILTTFIRQSHSVLRMKMRMFKIRKSIS